MSSLKRLMSVIVTLGFAATTLAAAQPAGRSDGELMMASVQTMIRVRVEYCLRNVPELREELSLAHQSFSLAASQATELLKLRFPGNNQTVRFASSDSTMYKEFALQQAHAEGFDRLCPELLEYMHDATAESLAKHYGDDFATMKK